MQLPFDWVYWKGNQIGVVPLNFSFLLVSSVPTNVISPSTHPYVWKGNLKCLKKNRNIFDLGIFHDGLIRTFDPSHRMTLTVPFLCVCHCLIKVLQILCTLLQSTLNDTLSLYLSTLIDHPAGSPPGIRIHLTTAPSLSRSLSVSSLPCHRFYIQ